MTDTIQRRIDTIPTADGGAMVHERVASAIEAAIAGGRFRPGERLPTHRELARQFAVSIGSVTRAMDALTARGVVRGEIGRGTFVLGVAASQDDGGIIDLTINAPAPVIDLAQMQRAAEQASRQALALPHGGYVDFTGTDRQRSVIAGWVGGRRTALKADDILLCNGAQQGLHLSFSAMRDTSPVILTEAASFPGALVAAANLGMRMRPVAHDAEGMLPDALADALRETGPASLYLTPVCQNPLGFETGPVRRREIAEVVRTHGATIIEDDVYGVYGAKGAPTYRDLLPEQTIYVTSLSKSVTPLVRLGVVAPPPRLLAGMRRQMRAESWGLPPYACEMAAALVETGVADAAADALRVEAMARMELAQAILGLRSVPMPAGAPHLFLHMPPLKAEQFARRASEAGVRITPPSAVQVGDAPVGGVRLCLLAPPTRAVLERALRTIAVILQGEEAAVV